MRAVTVQPPVPIDKSNRSPHTTIPLHWSSHWKSPVRWESERYQPMRAVTVQPPVPIDKSNRSPHTTIPVHWLSHRKRPVRWESERYQPMRAVTVQPPVPIDKSNRSLHTTIPLHPDRGLPPKSPDACAVSGTCATPLGSFSDACPARGLIHCDRSRAGPGAHTARRRHCLRPVTTTLCPKDPLKSPDKPTFSPCGNLPGTTTDRVEQTRDLERLLPYLIHVQEPTHNHPVAPRPGPAAEIPGRLRGLGDLCDTVRIVLRRLPGPGPHTPRSQSGGTRGSHRPPAALPPPGNHHVMPEGPAKVTGQAHLFSVRESSRHPHGPCRPNQVSLAPCKRPLWAEEGGPGQKATTLSYEGPRKASPILNTCTGTSDERSLFRRSRDGALAHTAVQLTGQGPARRRPVRPLTAQPGTSGRALATGDLPTRAGPVETSSGSPFHTNFPAALLLAHSGPALN
uniref:Uncharacterized protein n=1 Tax=Branchiostoma floridae TaxID=7739 RepID=C3Z3C9_BRAFL|eukprot:XP_002596961.1 hypothetical protein BRAFLDRAFT_76461 [Branchiostoma floridae]